MIRYLAIILSFLSASIMFADFKEYPIGKEIEINGMQIAAVYLKPIDMEPKEMSLPASESDIHLEADIHAIKGNSNGFGIGEWIPHLGIKYELKNLSTGKVIKGTFMPMVAADGPHYGANIKMLGTGKYHLTYTIESPDKHGFGRHTDSETGVGKWFQPFTVEFDFNFIPIK